jgi:tetratricopeptide (TPR) repeat protein
VLIRLISSKVTMESSGQTLKRAWELQQQRKYAKAEAIYWQVLALEPKNSLALFLLGSLELEIGRYDLSQRHLSAAVEGDPKQAVYHATLARAQLALGRHTEAVARFCRAIELDPQDATVFVNLGNALLHVKDAATAIGCYEKAIELDPELAEAYSCLGAVLQHQGRQDEAIAHYRQAIAARPEFIDAHYNLGTALLNLGRAEEARLSLSTAAELQPLLHAAHGNLAAAYHALGRGAEARLNIDRALELAPEAADYHCSRATILRFEGSPAEAIESYDRALSLEPKLAEASFGRALALLSLGRFSEAWPGFEDRLLCQPAAAIQLDQPLWDGSPLEGRTLVVYADGGWADTIQFVRFAKLAAKRGGNVVLVVPAELKALLAESGVEQVVARDEPLPPCDLQAPLLSLPGILGIELEMLPGEVPYLAIDPARIDAWRDAISPYRGFRVGIAWQGASRNRPDPGSAIPLGCFAPLAAVPGVDLISLQPQPRDSDPKLAGAAFSLAWLDDIESPPDKLLDAAAVMKHLDLVIAADSALAHLAGALGVPVWLAIRKGADWRWMLDRQDSPWYPTMRLFAQESRGDWSGAFERMAAELADVAHPHADPL